MEKQKKEISPTLVIRDTSNNILISSINLKDNYIISCGILGYKKSRRSTNISAQHLGEKAGELLVKQKIKYIYIIIRGFSIKSRFIIKGLKQQNIKIRKIKNKTNVPYNGCRKKKKDVFKNSLRRDD